MGANKNQTGRVVCYPRSIKLGGPEVESVEIMCGGDTHIGSPFTDSRHAFAIRQWLDEKPNRYFIHAGDLYEAATKDSIGDSYHCLPLDQAEDEAVRWLSGIGDERLIGFVSGNHDIRYAKAVGKDVVNDAAYRAGVHYDGDEAYINLRFGHWHHVTKNIDRPISYQLYLTHGVGGGRTDGAKMNNLTRLREIVVADIYVMGHQHDPVIKPKSVYEWDHTAQSIIERQQTLVVTGSALGRKGYAVQKAYAPVSTAFPILTLSGTRKQVSARLEYLY